MEKTRPNLYKLLKSEFKKIDSILDVGCGYMDDLIDFEYSGFQELKGIDKGITYKPYIDYCLVKFGEQPTDIPDTSERRVLNKYVNERFKTQGGEAGDLTKYNYIPDSVSFIICNNVLHFFPDEQKLELIGKFYQALQSEGLLYVKINHRDNLLYKDAERIEKISEGVYRSIHTDENIRMFLYPIDQEAFFHQLADYDIVSKYNCRNEDNFAFVIRK